MTDDMIRYNLNYPLNVTYLTQQEVWRRLKSFKKNNSPRPGGIHPPSSAVAEYGNGQTSIANI